jgi:hypothetical protein
VVNKRSKAAEAGVSSEEQAHLQRLLEAPDDIDAWRAFGAWLRDQGDPRGELIALEEAWRAAEAAGAEGEQSALQKLRDAEAAAYPGDTRTALSWCWGHVVEGWFASQKSLKALLASPFGRRLGRVGNGKNISGKQVAGWLAPLAAAPVQILHLRGELGLQGAEALARAQHLGQLKSLNLAGAKIGAEGMRALAKATHLDSLEALYLGGNELGDEGAQALAEGHFSSLRYLQLSGNNIGPAGAEALAKATQLSQLTFLNLGYNRLEGAGAQALAKASQLTSLTHLRLPGNGIDAAGAAALAQAAHFCSLVDLRLDNNPIGTEGAEALACSAHLEALTALSLAFNGVGSSTELAKQAERIQERSGLPSAAPSQAWNETTFIVPKAAFSSLPGHWPPDYWAAWGTPGHHNGQNLVMEDHWPLQRREPDADAIRRRDLRQAIGSDGPTVSVPGESLEDAARR